MTDFARSDAPIDLLRLSDALDQPALAARFARAGRVQVRDVLAPASAAALHAVLAERTRWGLAWSAGADGPHSLSHEEAARLPPAERRRVADAIMRAAGGRDYAFSFAHYPAVKAYLEKWEPGGPYDVLLEHLNDQPFLDFVRAVTGMPQLRKADAQATLFSPNQFLAEHVDVHSAEGWRVAYVLSLTREDWRPDWGGYLNFLDADGDVVEGWRPRFNALSLFAVPTPHNVSFVPPFAPVGRFSVTGWFRDR